MAVHLTQRHITSLQPKSTAYELLDTDLQGLLVRVQPSGRKVYYYRYQGISGKRQRVCLGPCNVITLENARSQVKVLAGQVAAGQDPYEEKKKAKAQKRKELLNTLGVFIDEEYAPWFLVHRKGGPRVITQAKRMYAFLLHVPMKEITPLSIDRWRTQKHQAGTKKETLNRYVGTLRSILNKAVEWDVIEKNPIKYISAYKVDNSKHVERYLSSEEEMNLRYAMDQREQQLREERQRYNAWNAERGYRFQLLCDYDADFRPRCLTNG